MIECKICGKNFNSYRSLSSHLISHKISSTNYYKEYISLVDTCIVCGKKTTFKTIEFGFRKYCSTKCSSSQEDVKTKVRKTKSEKYGDEYFNNKNKTKETNLDKYGCENVFQNEKIKNKIKQTNLNKYGVTNPLQNDDVKDKMKNTNHDRYNDKTFTSTEIGKNKVKETCIVKYGVCNAFQNEKIKNKIKQTNLNNLGVEYPMQSSIIMNKRKQTCLIKYGVESVLYLKEYRDKGKSSHPIKEYRLLDNRIIYYQSKIELNFIKKCENNNIYVENGDIIDYIFNDKNHKYFVDFKIKENDKWKLVEIKSKHNWFYKDIKSGKLESKFNSAIKYSKNNNYLDYVLILDKKEYFSYLDLKNDIII